VPPTATLSPQTTIDFSTHPSRYRHWRLATSGNQATLTLAVQQDGGLRPGYELKLNSYDLGVDIELADALERLVFEHPAVRAVVITGGLDRVFCAGANIHMLATSTHAFKVNFCKYTNETRLYIEDASATAGKRFLAALNGTASGGGYELALACDRILLADDKSSAVSFPELPLLGVLPGTGGLTRLADKRKVRRDLGDVFNTVAEGVKGKRAQQWGLVDRIAPLSRWSEAVREEAAALAAAAPTPGSGELRGIELVPLEYEESATRLDFRDVELVLDREARTAALSVRLPLDPGPRDAAGAFAQAADWWFLRLFRALDRALLHLRLNEPAIGLVTLRVVGPAATAQALDALLAASDHWFLNAARHFARRVLKRLENSAKSFYAVGDHGTAFVGTFFELALASDRFYHLNDAAAPVRVGLTQANAGMYPMANGLSRLETRFLATPAAVPAALARSGALLDAEEAAELGLSTFAPDEIDWEDELRLAVEERASFSPDGLTGMEQNLRFAGPETLETKIFGRLSAWQNWIFQRPNAVGERGALKCYGTPERPEFDFNRT
jgi:benzoyl-CoA-dihydrodiol lyase